MRTLDCERWVELVDSVALGETLTSAESRFEQQHVKECAFCAEEARVWSALGACLEDDRASSPNLFEAAAPQNTQKQPTKRLRVRLWTLSAAMAAGVIAALAWRTLPSMNEPEPSMNEPDSIPAVSQTKAPPVDLRLVSGEVNVGGSAASAGATLSTNDHLSTQNGRACVAYSNGTSACLSEQSEMRPAGQSENDRKLHLSRGEVVCNLDRQPDGTVFSVETTRGTVVAKGTAFAVAYLQSSEVEVRLHRGVVEVRSTTGEVRELHAPASLVLGKNMRHGERSSADWDRDEAALSVTQLWADGAIAPLDISPKTDSSSVSLGGVKLGSAPVSMLLSRGQYELLIEAKDHNSHQETLMIAGAGRVTRSPELESSAPQVPAAAIVVAPSSDAASSAPALLTRAQKLRQAGKFREAAASYQALTQTFPNSAEARAAWLSLGELQLSRLGSPSQALASFEHYLSKKGALSQEAYYGKIRALRALGRTGAARAEAEKFVLAYPGTAQAVSLKQWLSAPAKK